MPNIASVFKEEIARLSRKEIRAHTDTLKKESARFRRDIAALKREVTALQKKLQRLDKVVPKKNTPLAAEEPESRLRFSASGFGHKRSALGLSAAEVAALLGVSAQSIYKWEDGKARPRASQLPAIAAFRKMGKKEAAAALESLNQ